MSKQRPLHALRSMLEAEGFLPEPAAILAVLERCNRAERMVRRLKAKEQRRRAQVANAKQRKGSK